MKKSFSSSNVFFIIIFAAFALLTIARAVIGIPTPHLHNYGESIVLANAWGLATGHGLYRWSELDNVPMFFAAYPPIFYLPVAAGIKMWGISYVFGRSLVLLSMIGCSIMIAAIARRLGCDNLSSFAGGIMFMATWPIYVFGSYLRVDGPAVLFELIAVFILLKPKMKLRHAIGFVFFAVLAGYTKQLAFTLVAGALLGMLIGGDGSHRKRLFGIGAAYGATAILVFLAIEYWTGWHFHQFVMAGVDKSFSWEHFIRNTMEMVRDPITVAVAILGIMGFVYRRERIWYSALIIVPMAMAFRLVGVRGADINHFFEPMAACCIGAALFMNMVGNKKLNGHFRACVFLLLIFVFSLAESVYLRKGSTKKAEMILTDSGVLTNQTLKSPTAVSLMKEFLSPGDLVLSQHPDLPLFAGCLPAMTDPLTISLISNHNGEIPLPVVEALGDRRVKLVIMKEEITTAHPMQFLPKGAAEAIEDNYHRVPLYSFGYAFYEPK